MQKVIYLLNILKLVQFQFIFLLGCPINNQHCVFEFMQCGNKQELITFPRHPLSWGLAQRWEISWGWGGILWGMFWGVDCGRRERLVWECLGERKTTQSRHGFVSPFSPFQCAMFFWAGLPRPWARELQNPMIRQEIWGIRIVPHGCFVLFGCAIRDTGTHHQTKLNWGSGEASAYVSGSCDPDNFIRISGTPRIPTSYVPIKLSSWICATLAAV